MPKFECHYCTQHIDADDSLSGRGVDCPTCGTPLTVPPTATADQKQSASPPQTPADAIDRMRNWAGVAALGALGIAALCVIIPYASAGSRGMAVFDIASWLGQTTGRAIAAIAVGAVISVVVAGISHALNKPFAFNFYRAFTWAVIAASLPQLVPSIREGFAVAKMVSEKDHKKAAEKKVLSAAMLEIESATEEVFSTADAGGPSSSPTNTQAEPSDGAAEMKAVSTVIRELSQDVIRARKDYERALDEAGIGKLLDANRVAADANFTDTLAILMKVRSAVAENRRRSEQAMTSLPERFERFNLSPAAKQRVVDGLQKGYQKGVPLMQEGLDLEDKVVELFEKVIDHLMATKGRWTAAGETFMFYEDEDLETFTSLTQKIQNCVARQEAIQKEAANHTAQKLEDMRDLLQKY